MDGEWSETSAAISKRLGCESELTYRSCHCGPSSCCSSVWTCQRIGLLKSSEELDALKVDFCLEAP